MDAVAERLASVLDELVALEDDVLRDDELVVALSRARSRLDAVVCRQSAAFAGSTVWVDAGAQNVAAWLTEHCRLERNRARRRVRAGRMLRVMELVDASFAAGHITDDHVELLARARDRSTRSASAFGRDQAMLVEWAETLAFHRFKRRLDEWRLAVDEEATEHDGAAVHDARSVHLSQSYEDRWFLDGVLDPLGGAIVAETLRSITDELFEADWKQASEALGTMPTRDELIALTRTAAQRRADALVEMATRARVAPADGRRPQPLFTVLVGEAAFARTVELASGVGTTPGQLAPWLDGALIERIVFDGPDRVMAVGAPRSFRGALRRAVQVLGRRCSAACCDEPAVHCEVDHIQPDSMGGATTMENGRLYCRFHHRLHHRENHAGFPTGR